MYILHGKVNMEVFRAGCDSRPAVSAMAQVRERFHALSWCDSSTDSIVWMEEDAYSKRTFIFTPGVGISPGVFFLWRNIYEK